MHSVPSTLLPSLLAGRLSTFERDQLKLKKQIEELEDYNVAEKPWQLTGGGSAGISF